MKRILKIEIWYKKDRTLILLPSPKNDFYLKFRDGTAFISGITLYWLLSHGYERLAKINAMSID